MTQATASTIWPRVALFNYFAVQMPPEGTATARRLPFDWTSSLRGGECYGSAAKTKKPRLTDQEWELRIAQRKAERTKRGMP